MTGLAEVYVAGEAPVASPARDERPHDDAVALRQPLDAGRRHDPAGELVTEHLAGLGSQAAMECVQVRSADAAGGNLDDSLPGARLGVADLGELDALGLDPVGGAHGHMTAPRASEGEAARAALWTSTTARTGRGPGVDPPSDDA